MSRWDVTATLAGHHGTARYGKTAGEDGWWLLDLDDEPVRWTDDPGWLRFLVDEELDLPGRGMVGLKS